MDRRLFIKRGFASFGSIASLLSLTEKSQTQAIKDFIESSTPNSGLVRHYDYLQIEPHSPSFQSLIRGFNCRWTAVNARSIYIPMTESGIISALNAIKDAGLERNFKIRGGGHCYEDFVFNSEVKAIIDVSLLKAVSFDSEKGVYYAQAGATNYDLQAGLIRYGKTLPGGSCWTVGMGGHISGGGYGLLSRLHGLVVDWLTGVSLIHMKDGLPKAIRVERASTRNESDLFWAHTGGGGGNYGIISRYEFSSLPNAPEDAEIINIAWDWHHIINNGGSDYLKRIINCFESLCVNLGNNAFLILKLTHKDCKQVQLFIHQVDSISSGTLVNKVQKSLSSFDLCINSLKIRPIACHPLQTDPESYKKYTWWQAVYALSASGGPWNGKYKSAYMRKGFSNEDIKKIYIHLTRTMPVSMEYSMLQVNSYGGKINEISKELTAVWQRDSIFKLQYQTYWPMIENEKLLKDYETFNLKWIRDFYTDIYISYGGIPDPDPASGPNTKFDGCYINYPDIDLNQYGLRKALQLYYGGNLPRLIKTKKYWDPNNIFNHLQSIPIL